MFAERRSTDYWQLKNGVFFFVNRTPYLRQNSARLHFYIFSMEEKYAHYSCYVSSRNYFRLYWRRWSRLCHCPLTLLFHIPIHTALGTSLAGMAFTSLSGAYSHYREGNIQMKIGLIVGGFAAVGSFFGAKLTSLFRLICFII